MAADVRVWENAGKVALMKGPFVYCLEETDNGKNLASVLVNTSEHVAECQDDTLPGGLPALLYKGKRLAYQNQNSSLYGDAHFETESTPIKAVPYCLWGNRKPGEMLVWQNALIW